MSKSTTRCVTFAVAVLAIGASPAIADGGKPSLVSIDTYGSDDMSRAVIKGHVASTAKCVKGRTVKVIGRDEQTGDKRSFGTDKTSGAGKFSVSEPIPFDEDFAYAKVKAETVDGVRCGGDRSEEISLAG